ncbi:MAG: metallophosphoesterase [Candidatus Bathyarchaeia archaeon]
MVQNRILFTTDLHGSNICFRKFLNAAKIYKANTLIIGGDITGKGIVPIIKQEDGSYKAELFGVEQTAKHEQELKNLEEKIGAAGFYFIKVSKEEHKALSTNEKALMEAFNSLMVQRIKEWVALAEKTFKNEKVKFYMLPGNDDIFEIDSVINESDYVVNPEGKCVLIDEEHEMISTGYANITPWHCPRDIPEEELEKKIEEMVTKIENMSTAIFCFHVPPYGTKLDQAPKLDEKLQIVIEGGHVVMTSAGSVAVRKAIEKYQPLLGLHGHIHESRAFDKIGRTMCFNPGSEYGEGIFHGALISLDKDKVKGYMLMTG